MIPAAYACGGADASPPLEWSEVPAGTRSFALIMEDPDAPAGTWIHWVLYDLPHDLRKLGSHPHKSERLSGGGKHGACWGVDSFTRTGYHGPCPPPGPAHRYRFTLYALSSAPDLPAGRTKAELLAAMEGTVLARAELSGRFAR